MRTQKQYIGVAVRTYIPHVEACWECSKHLMDEKGRCLARKRGPCIAYIATIDGYERKLHRMCAELLGFELNHKIESQK